MGRIIAIANQKGGVGKTTTSVNLSAALAEEGRNVLLLDIDPQGNATSGLGIDKFSVTKNIYDVFSGQADLNSVSIETNTAGLFVAPSHPDLVGAELELSSVIGRELILKDALSQITSQYDYIFIDCPPSLGLLTVNAFVAADSIIVPLQCEYYALEGVTALIQTIELAQQRLNPRLEIEGVVLTMYDGRTNLSRQVEKETRDFFQGKVFSTVIPRNIKLSECPSFGQPISVYDRSSLGAGAYCALGRELDARYFESTTQAKPKRARAQKAAPAKRTNSKPKTKKRRRASA